MPLAVPVSADYWLSGFDVPRFNGSADCTVVHDDGSGPALFIGGYFGVETDYGYASNIAK